MYLVVDGLLEVVHSTEAGDLVVGTLGPTEIVGEITAVIGGRRTATVRAADAPVTVREFSADDYAAWLQDRPEEAQRIADQARDRIDKTRVARVLTDLIGPGHPDVIDDVNALLEWTRLEAGEQLFVQGDVADAAYIAVTGRLRLTATNDGAQTLDVSIGRGDIVGELGIIEQAPTVSGSHGNPRLDAGSPVRGSLRDVDRPPPQADAAGVPQDPDPGHAPESDRAPEAGMIAVAVLSPECRASTWCAR